MTFPAARTARPVAVIASVWGVLGPFWFAFVGSAVLVVVMWRQFAHISYDDHDVSVAPAPGT